MCATCAVEGGPKKGKISMKVTIFLLSHVKPNVDIDFHKYTIHYASLVLLRFIGTKIQASHLYIKHVFHPLYSLDFDFWLANRWILL